MGKENEKYFGSFYAKLGNAHPEIVAKNCGNIGFYGRFDDLYSLVGTKSEKAMWAFVKEQLERDMHAEHPSLLAKWLKSENVKSSHGKAWKARKNTHELGQNTAIALGMTPKQYRQTLSSLRNKIRIIETQLCKKEWASIQY